MTIIILKLLFQVFGNIRGERCVICIDTSDANTGFGRLTAFQESLIVNNLFNNINIYHILSRDGIALLHIII